MFEKVKKPTQMLIGGKMVTPDEDKILHFKIPMEKWPAIQAMLKKEGFKVARGGRLVPLKPAKKKS